MTRPRRTKEARAAGEFRFVNQNVGSSLLVYPSGYTPYEERHLDGNIWEEGGEDRLGHTARELGVLVSAWDSVKHGATDPSDGGNLVLHEFAHQLDFEDLQRAGSQDAG